MPEPMYRIVSPFLSDGGEPCTREQIEALVNETLAADDDWFPGWEIAVEKDHASGDLRLYMEFAGDEDEYHDLEDWPRGAEWIQVASDIYFHRLAELAEGDSTND